MKTCTKCKIEKDLSEFHKSKAAKSGYHFACKSCKSAFYQANKEKYREVQKQYLAK
jgi:hypothetical protein